MKTFQYCLVALMFLSLITPSKAQSKKMKNPVIAHRGAWKNSGTPQNSIASLKEAIRLGCIGSEFDVRITLDGFPVVVHDPTHDGVSIDSSNFSVVRKLKLSNGEQIPTLEEYLLAGANQSVTKLVLEIKTSRLGKSQSLLLARKCVETVQRLKLQKKVDYIAFDHDVCKLVRELDKKANIAYLNGDIKPGDLLKDGIRGIDYNVNVFKKNESWIQEAKTHKISLNVWTVNKEEDMKRFLSEGFDFITTDEPELLFSLWRDGRSSK
jgi:glycerophosphoryl diester phosphodiesterase